MTDETAVRPEVVEFANDMLVSTDLMRDLIGEVETYRVDEAVYLRHTLGLIMKQAKEAIAALDLHLLDVLEEPVQHKGWIFRRGHKKDRERFDHDEIAKRVRSLVCGKLATGDQLVSYANGVSLGASEAVDIMRNIYISPSTTAKIGQLERLGIPCDPRSEVNGDESVRTWAKGDPYVDVSPVMSQVQE